MTIRKEILDELIRDYKNPEDLLGENGLLKQLTKALLERAMNAELTHELGFEKNDKSSLKENGNRRRLADYNNQMFAESYLLNQG